VAVVLGGWVQNLLADRLEGRSGESEFDRSVERFTNFERMLSADGTVFVKLWMHLPKREHEKRIAKARRERGDTWRVDEIDWRICDNYDALAPLAEELLQRTTTEETTWRVIESTDSRHRGVACAERVLEAIQGAIAAAPREPPKPAAPAPAPSPSVLDRVDLSESLRHKEYKPRLEELQRRLFKFVERAEKRGMRTLLVFEGWDAAGKGGVIRRITHALDARDYSVVPMGAPTEEEQQYHYLWRFWRHVPRAGKMVIFDRSWYGRVLVERVEGFTSEPDWQRAYKEINAFEQELVEANTVLLKFWLHIDADEQLRRFRDREKTPYKKYKITDEDYRNRDQWDAYVAAVHDMVEHTSTKAAPWHLVAANDKRLARIQVIETVCDALKAASKKGRKG
jgi:polyphosphate:AMP phosphotransferase